tara:strand:+ start:195 stop:1070 length:876 start_codon:yes stop_codon:yes gene_type:complete
MKKSDQIKKYLSKLSGEYESIFFKFKLFGQQDSVTEAFIYDKISDKDIDAINRMSEELEIITTKIEKPLKDFIDAVEEEGSIYFGMSMGILNKWLEYPSEITENEQKVDFYKLKLKEYLTSLQKEYFDLGIWHFHPKNEIEDIKKQIESNVTRIKSLLTDLDIMTFGLDSIEDIEKGKYTFEKSQLEGNLLNSNFSAKLKLSLFYKLGIIDHLRTFESLKNNDRALSRLLHKILESGKPDTFQTYLSAQRSGDHSSAPQNNPLSQKLKEEAEEILGKTDLTNSDLQKYYPL